MIFPCLQGYLEIISIYVDVYELVKAGGFLQFCCAESNHQIILAFG